MTITTTNMSPRMSTSADPGADALCRNVPERHHALLHGHLLAAARVTWLGVAVFAMAAYAASVWSVLRHLQSACPPGVCLLNGQVPLAVRQAFATLHLPIDFLAGYTLALNVTFALSFAAIGVVIFLRRSRDPLALYISLTLLVFGVGAFIGDMWPLQLRLPLASLPAWRWPVDLLDFLGVAAFGFFLCVFPDGRFVPRWTAAAATAWALWMLPTYVAPDSSLSFESWPAPASLGVWALFLGTFVFAQVYRYQHVSTPVQQVQTKWVVLGITAAAVGHFGGMFLRALQPPLLISVGALLGILAGDTLMYASVLLIPLTIGIAMLRYHLFDVDQVIRLTLGYSALAAVLALIYEGGVGGAERVVLALTGESNLTAKVLAAFAAGALARPVYRQLDRALTRAFYPRRYEAERRIEAFGKQVRRDLHLETVPERLRDAAAGRLLHGHDHARAPGLQPGGLEQPGSEMSRPPMCQRSDGNSPDWIPPLHPRPPP
ncbi:MAG TPA: hypothetical protein VF040_04200 [Ktedonobacterales bacterium]